MVFGIGLSLDDAPIKLRQSRALGLLGASFGLLIVTGALVAEALAPVRLPLVGTLLMAAFGIFILWDSLERIARPQRITIGRTGLLIEHKGSSKLFAWNEIGSFLALGGFVMFAQPASPEATRFNARASGILPGYFLMPGTMPRLLKEARSRWATSPEPRHPPMTRSSKIWLWIALAVIVVLNLLRFV